MSSYAAIDAHYEPIARAQILALIEREHAVLWLEIEAKLAETPRPGAPQGINPHILTRARHSLLFENVIEAISGVTRGGASFDVIALTNRSDRETAFQKAAARKRLLQARYMGWTRKTAKYPSMIGEAGERVARASLRAAHGAGYLPHESQKQVASLFNAPVPGGPLDDAAYLVVLDSDGMPKSLTIAIEVKNIRQWLYSSAKEIYQLLEKCANLQIQHPHLSLVPVMVCRKAHITAFKMAKDLGFAIQYTGVQPILPHSEVDPEALEEVRLELGYDLVRTDSAHDYLTRAFQVTLPRIAVSTSDKWKQNAPVLAAHFARLRDDNLSDRDRRIEMDALRTHADELGDTEGGW